MIRRREKRKTKLYWLMFSLGDNVKKQDLNQSPKPSPRHPGLSLRRRNLFRAAAVALGLLPFLLLELVLLAVGWRGSNGVDDPYIGFTEIRPLFVKNVDATRFEIAENRKPLFQPDSFLAKKPDDEFRIFCVGGSTVQGRPYSIETAFSKWLELSLTAADDSRRWKVINCGGVSYASYRLVPIVDEILAYQPDLIVLYTGHNEFLEDRTYAAIKQEPLWLVRTHERLSSLRSYSFLRSQFVSANNSPQTETLPAEVEARLDFQGGLDLYSRDDAWQQKVVADFEQNLRRMAFSIQQTGVPLFLVNPVCNLRDVAPFKSSASPEMTQEQFETFNAKLLAAGQISSLDEKLSALQALAKINPRHANLQFQLGQAFLAQGKLGLARQHLIAAKDEDICPLRATEPIYNAIDKVRQEFNLPMVDAMLHFSTQAQDGIPGREALVDHVHPSIHGHQQIADLIIDQMQSQDVVKVKADSAKLADLYRRHFESLDNFYFERAKDRLDGLQRWAEGKVRRVRDVTPGKKTSQSRD
jgi:lysophospholipase L1-like esterase